MRILNETYDNERIRELISICKSNSGVMGARLRAAHHELGMMVGSMIVKEYRSDKPFAVVLLMRSAAPFGEGIADYLDCPLLFLDEKHDRRWKMNDCNNKFIMDNRGTICQSTLILADAVINTGETISQIYDTLIKITDDIMLAANVIQSGFDPGSKTVFGTRLSDNKFKGSQVLKQRDGKGPDTGDRLFRTLASVDDSA
ncbi:MAG: phosphoribosyltransferase [Candidatus Methanomethylophilaceae archaeon]|nr:phosphoribosyltransferase [Candidatus Methanomethylophilaceae archaeon]